MRVIFTWRISQSPVISVADTITVIVEGMTSHNHCSTHPPTIPLQGLHGKVETIQNRRGQRSRNTWEIEPPGKCRVSPLRSMGQVERMWQCPPHPPHRLPDVVLDGKPGYHGAVLILTERCRVPDSVLSPRHAREFILTASKLCRFKQMLEHLRPWNPHIGIWKGGNFLSVSVRVLQRTEPTG